VTIPPPPLPPLDAVRAVQSALADAGLPSVVGGSALLASLGLPIEAVRDWDVVVDADPEAVAAALAGLPHPVTTAPSPAPAPYDSEALLVVDAGEHTVDVIVRFRLRTPEGVIRVPAQAGGSWNGLVMARAEEWSAAYRAMGRPDRAALLESAGRRAPGSG